MNHKTKTIALLSIYIAIAFLFGYIESLFPLPVLFPGMKLGLANLVIVLALYQLSLPSVLLISVLRNLLNAFTFGSMFSFLYSLTGSIASLLIMYIVKKTQLSRISVSCVGGIVHNIGQFVIAACLVGPSAVLPYLPFLYFAGFAAGILIGVLADLCLRRIPISNMN